MVKKLPSFLNSRKQLTAKKDPSPYDFTVIHRCPLVTLGQGQTDPTDSQAGPHKISRTSCPHGSARTKCLLTKHRLSFTLPPGSLILHEWLDKELWTWATLRPSQHHLPLGTGWPQTDLLSDGVTPVCPTSPHPVPSSFVCASVQKKNCHTQEILAKLTVSVLTRSNRMPTPAVIALFSHLRWLFGIKSLLTKSRFDFYLTTPRPRSNDISKTKICLLPLPFT